VANPASGFRLFKNYDHYAQTNEEQELLALARLDREASSPLGEPEVGSDDLGRCGRADDECRLVH
jgi:hypothetical protein